MKCGSNFDIHGLTFCSIPATNIHQISPTLLKIQGGGAFGGYK